MRNPMVTGDRVYLRPQEPGDADKMAEFFAAETDDFIDDLGRYPISPITMDYLARESGKSRPPSSIALAACLIEGDELLGIIGIDRIDYIHGTGETFSYIRPGEFRGHGYGTESKMLLLEYAFDHLQLHIIQSGVFEANERSAAALLKQGYKPAGRMKWLYSRRGVYRDLLLFDVKRGEWDAAREALRSR